MTIFQDIGRAAKKLPKTVKSATVGKKGLLGKQGTVGLLLKGKVQKAAKATGKAVSSVTTNPLIQGSFTPITVPTSIVSSVVGHGPKGGLRAAKSFTKNPVVKAELAAVGVLVPPLAPASAGALAAMEAGSRVIDGINSKDPKKVAGAVMQVAGTQLLASQGNPDAKRALTLMKDLNVARKIALGQKGGIAGLQRAAKSGSKAAKKALGLVQHQALRNAHQTVNSKNAPRKEKLAARNLITKAQTKAPGLLAGTLAALQSPKGVRVGDFSLLRTGRILYRGKPIRKAA